MGDGRTNEAGAFTTLYLPAGTYKVEVSLPGFATFRRTGVALASTDTTRRTASVPATSTATAKLTFSIRPDGGSSSWFEQKREGGTITFVEHPIAGNFAAKNAGGVTFSEPHGSTAADVDRDGVLDFRAG